MSAEIQALVIRFEFTWDRNIHDVILETDAT